MLYISALHLLPNAFFLSPLLRDLACYSLASVSMSVDSANAPLLDALAMTTPDPTRSGHTATPSDFVHSATETDAKGGDAKACAKLKEMGEGQEGYKEGISIGPTRDGKSLTVKRPSHGPSKETRAWEAQTPVRRNRHDRQPPAWAHDSDVEEEALGAREVLKTTTKEPATPGEEAADAKAAGHEEAAADAPALTKFWAPDTSTFEDVPLSTPPSDADEVAKGFMAAEEITAHDDAAALPRLGETTADADGSAAAVTLAPHVTDEQRPRTSQLLGPRAITSTTAGAISTCDPDVTDAKESFPDQVDRESFPRTPFSKRPIGKTDNVEAPAQKKQTLQVAAMCPGSPGADHPPPAL